MKRIVWVMALCLLLLPACSTEQNRASEGVNNAAETAREQKQIFQDKAEAKLRDLDQQVDVLQAKMRKETGVERKQLDQEEVELDRKREDAHQKLEKLKTSSQEAGRDMEAGFDAAIDDLKAACQRADSHFN